MIQRFLLLSCCLLLCACSVVDIGVGRDANTWPTKWTHNAYADFGWPQNDKLLLVDFIGGPDSYTLVRAELWRLLHLEIGLLGLGVGLGPLQAGIGAGLYAPHPPAEIAGSNPFKG